LVMTLKWFKQWGWLYLPASIPGVVIFLTMLGFCVSVFLAMDHRSHSVSDTFYQVFPFSPAPFSCGIGLGQGRATEFLKKETAMNYEKQIEYFTRNRKNRREPD